MDRLIAGEALRIAPAEQRHGADRRFVAQNPPPSPGRIGPSLKRNEEEGAQSNPPDVEKAKVPGRSSHVSYNSSQ